MNCEFCDKLCKNKNSLAQHIIRCKSNPDKIIIKSNFIKYNDKIKNQEINKLHSNQYTKAKNLGLEKPIINEETLNKWRTFGKSIIWTDEKKEKHSLVMINTAIKYPESYSANNVCGRTKLIETIDSYNNLTKVNGNWEKNVVDYLNINNIKWTNKIEEKIFYNWKDKQRRYYPDFYLPDYNIYLEVKGYERERDLEKWKIITNKLIIIKDKEIKMIKNNTFNIFLLLNNLLSL